MTTFQDPPLQSRRAVRQNEREQAPSAVVPSSAPAPTAPSGAPAEPLTYSTQGRPPVPDYDGPSFRARRTPEPVDEADLTTEADQDAGTYRPRDFSPEGRRAAAPSWAPQYGGVGDDGNIEYQTQQRGAAAAPASAPAEPNSTFAPHAPVPPTIIPSALDSEEFAEHTLTRRELRALRDAHGITSTTTDETVYPTPEPTAPEAAAAPVAPAAAPAPVVPAAPAASGTPLAAPSTRLDSALAEFDALAGGRPAPVPTDPPAARGRRAAASAAAAAAAAPEAAAPAAPVAPAPAPAPPAGPAGPAQIAPEALEVPLVQPPTQAPAPQQAAEVVVAEIVAEPVAPAPALPTSDPVIEATVVEATIEEPPTSTPPVGHWSTQAQLDDETQLSEAPLSRNIGNTSGAITTSALVLPSIPDHDFGPLTSGEIMVTGSISLPQSMSATGAYPAQLDESDLDHLLDPGDHQVASTDSQPVRAIKAVSTHTSSGGVIQTVKPKGTRGLTALIIAATGMAVVVGALFIVLVATGQL